MAYLQANNKYIIMKPPIAITPIGYNAWTNSSWDTFTSSGINVTSAIEAGGNTCWADSNTLTLVAGQKVYFKHNTTVNSGSSPALDLMGFWNTYSLNLTPATNGIERSFPILTEATDNYKLRFRNIGTNATDCSCSFEFYEKGSGGVNKLLTTTAIPGKIYFQTLGDKVVFDSQPDVTGNKTLKADLFIDSTSSDMTIGLMNASNDFLWITYTLGPDTGPNKVLVVNTRNSPPGVIRPYYDISSYLNQVINLEVVKTSSAVTSVKINGTTLTKIGDGYFNNGGSTVKEIAGILCSIWNLEVVGVVKWIGFPYGNTTGAWVDTIGTNDGTVSGSPTTRNL